MVSLDLNFLINTPIKEVFNKLNSVFENLIQIISSYLVLDPIFNQITVKLTEPPEVKEINFINFGVRKDYKDNSLSISIFNIYSKFIHLILLREAYKSFIPVELQSNEIINIFINEKVQIDLQDSDYIEDWKELRRKEVISYEFMEAEFDRLGKFLKQEGTENRPSPFQYFFSYIRRNFDLIRNFKGEESGRKNFYDLIFEEYSQKYTEYTDDILETVRIISKIFYKVKSYRSILDYQKLFKEFKLKGLIQTTLSQRKFIENMQWIKNFTYLAPNYYINWFSLDIISTLCILKFHP